uniref:HPr kinase/phosphorylase n=1 Tax=candidate division WOR-3 bacterium TaxID=2052148 RepID=A0A7C4XEL2_UNCW3
MNQIPAETLYKEKRKDFSFEIISGGEYLKDRFITTYDVFRPGLALAGYTGYFLSDRIMIIGKTETSYLKILDEKIKNRRVATIMKLGTPCVIVTKKLKVDKILIYEAEKRKIPILRTPMSTTPFIHALSTYLDYKLAPTKYIQGTLMDIYGVGILFIGKPGTGKSECALDLVERGHRLVADDLVKIIKRGEILIGTGAEKSDRLRHHLEIRGVGIIDVFRIFGVKSVRLRKRIEVIIEFIFWDEAKGEYDRLGLSYREKTILGIKIPHILIPLTPGKNISVIAEVVAMNYLLKLRGIDAAKEYDRELKRVLAKNELPSVYFDEDIE